MVSGTLTIVSRCAMFEKMRYVVGFDGSFPSMFAAIWGASAIQCNETNRLMNGLSGHVSAPADERIVKLVKKGSITLLEQPIPIFRRLPEIVVAYRKKALPNELLVPHNRYPKMPDCQNELMGYYFFSKIDFDFFNIGFTDRLIVKLLCHYSEDLAITAMAFAPRDYRFHAIRVFNSENPDAAMRTAKALVPEEQHEIFEEYLEKLRSR